MKTNLLPKPLHEMTQSEILNLWRSERARYFRKLNTEEHLSLEVIGEKHGCTRQAVSQLIRRYERGAESVTKS